MKRQLTESKAHPARELASRSASLLASSPKGKTMANFERTCAPGSNTAASGGDPRDRRNPATEQLWGGGRAIGGFISAAGAAKSVLHPNP